MEHFIEEQDPLQGRPMMERSLQRRLHSRASATAPVRNARSMGVKSVIRSRLLLVDVGLGVGLGLEYAGTKAHHVYCILLDAERNSP